MKILSVGDFKARFSEVIKWIRKGDTVAVTFGKKKMIIGYFTPQLNNPTDNRRLKRNLGILSDGSFQISKDWLITEEEFINE
jgi:hypothetical protein